MQVAHARHARPRVRRLFTFAWLPRGQSKDGACNVDPRSENSKPAPPGKAKARGRATAQETGLDQGQGANLARV